jgi:hypothetical protein
MAKVGRNDPCKCGSGKKSKKCCAAPGGSQTIPSSWNPRALLTNKPGALALFDQVSGFYGDKFKILEQRPEIAKSEVEIRRHLTPEREVEIDEARITLQIRSLRPEAALTHELLHLKLFSTGYPLPIVCEPDPIWSARAFKERLVDPSPMAGFLFNVIHHEIFLSEFVRLGFPLSEFVGERTVDSIDNAAKRARAMLDMSEQAPFVRGLWNLYYLTEFISDHLETCNIREQMVLEHGREFLPTIDADASFMRDWFQSGGFKASHHYASEVNALLAKIGAPRMVFGVIRREASGTLRVLTGTDFPF